MSAFPRPFSRFGSACLVVVTAVLLSGCSAATAAPEQLAPSADGGEASGALLLDNCGFEVTFEAVPQRIVTVKSSTTELVLALGAGDRLVGSAFADGPLPADWALAAEGVPVLSDAVPSQESVLELEPDLVFAGWESNFSAEGVGERDSLQRVGVNTYVAPAACLGDGYRPVPLTFEVVFESFMQAGEILGTQEAAAELVSAQRAQLGQLHPDARGLSAVWYSSGGDQPFVGGGVGAPQMLMEHAGLSNAFADVTESWFSASWEKLAEVDPDVIVLVNATRNTAEEKIARLQSNPATAALTAVREHRFVVIDFAATESGVRNVDAVASLIDQLGDL